MPGPGSQCPDTCRPADTASTTNTQPEHLHRMLPQTGFSLVRRVKKCFDDKMFRISCLAWQCRVGSWLYPAPTPPSSAAQSRRTKHMSGTETWAAQNNYYTLHPSIHPGPNKAVSSDGGIYAVVFLWIYKHHHMVARCTVQVNKFSVAGDNLCMQTPCLAQCLIE